MFRHLALTLTLGLATAPVVAACSCAPPLTVAQAMEDAAAVFVGRITRVETVGSGFRQKRRASVAVEGVWKGEDIRETAQVLTNTRSASCGLAFQPGQTWVIYAYQRPEQVGGGLGSNLCTRSRRLADDPESEQERIDLGPPVVTFTDAVQEAPTLEDVSGGPLPPEP